MRVSVILPTRNPRKPVLRRALSALRRQTLSREEWELLVVDNGSDPALDDDWVRESGPEVSHRLIHQPQAGLTPARLAGIAAAKGELLVFVDDDNLLDEQYLAAARAAFIDDPSLAAAGGPVVPEYEIEPPTWAREFESLLAIRELGPARRHAIGGPAAAWPDFAPVGAGLCIRRESAGIYARAVASDPRRADLDRRAEQLTSGGDNDMVFTTLRNGGGVAYLPELRITHLIPGTRLAPRYLARLNRSIQRSWVRVLELHGVRPWPRIPRWTLRLRLARAWWRSKAWRGPRENIRYHGLAGRLSGQADLSLER